MRWIHVRKAAIDPELRKTFEQYGTVTMQMMLATNGNMYRHQGSLFTVEKNLSSLLSWLTEQYDRAERKETWSLTMEIAITILVAAELGLSFVNFCRTSM
jgi:hypothetical protein